MSEGALPGPDATAPRLDAEAILAAELPLALRGYRIADVDALLGELALQVAASDAELTRLRARAGEPDPGTGGSAVAPSTASPDVTGSAAPDPSTAAATVAPAPAAEVVGPADAPVLGGTGEAPPGPAGSDGPQGRQDERPREVTVVASAARRRALVPSIVLTVAAVVALVVGSRSGDRTAVVASIAASAAALLGVGIAILVTRARRSD